MWTPTTPCCVTRACSDMRVLYVHHSTAGGGAFLSLRYLLRALAETEVEPVVLNSVCSPEVGRALSADGVPTVEAMLPLFTHIEGHTPMGDFARAYRQFGEGAKRFSRVLAEVKPDLVHLNSSVVAPYAAVARRCGVPCVAHVREAVSAGRTGLRRRWLLGGLEAGADAVITICEDNFSRLGRLQERTTVIYNPVDFAKFDRGLDRAEARSALGLPTGAPVVLFAGGSLPIIKGIEVFLDAMSLLGARVPGAVLLMPSLVTPFDTRSMAMTPRRIVGRAMGKYKTGETILNALDRSGVTDQIVATGFREDIETFIAAADAVCVPHITPHFSRTVIEAGAMARPVVASRIGGIEEAVHDGRTGLLVPPGNAPALADAVERVLTDRDLADRLSDGAYELALQRVEAGAVARAVLEVYGRVLKGNAGGA